MHRRKGFAVLLHARGEKIDFVAARILKKYRRAFEELAK